MLHVLLILRKKYRRFPFITSDTHDRYLVQLSAAERTACQQMPPSDSTPKISGCGVHIFDATLAHGDIVNIGRRPHSESLCSSVQPQILTVLPLSTCICLADTCVYLLE